MSDGPAYVPSVTALAKALGVTRRTATRWVAQGAPKRTRKGFDVEATKRWHAEQPAARGGRPVTKRIQSDGKLRREAAQAELAELDVAERKGRLVDRAEVEQREVEQALAVKAALYGLCRRLPGKLEMRQAREIELVLRDEVDRICRTFAGLPAEKAKPKRKRRR